MSFPSNNNTCVICLDPLLKADDDAEDQAMCDVGAAVSCGHPVHCACFDSWAEFHQKSKMGDDHKGVPCPTCQQETTSFVKIFLRPESQSNNPDFSDEEDADDEEESGEEKQQQPNNKKESQSKARSKAPSRRNKTCKRKVQKKAQFYKKKWMGKVEEVKNMKLEAKNRKKSHHEDLIDLERSQLFNFRLMKQLEQTVKAARFRRNVVGSLCFGLGWLCSRKISFSS